MKVKFLAITALMTGVSISAFIFAFRFFAPEVFTDTEITQNAEVRELPARVEAAEEPPAVAAASLPDRINEDTIIVYEYYHESDGKTERVEHRAPYALVGLTREELFSKIDGFDIVSFSQKEVVIRKRVETQNVSYLLGVWDGQVAVFYAESGINENGLKEVTDTPVSSLAEGERQRLAEGIEINGDEQLMKVLEDYGS